MIDAGEKAFRRTYVSVGRVWPNLLVAVVVSTLAMLMVTGGRWPGTHEGIRYMVLAEHFRDAMAGGQLYPRWLPNLYGGFGYPTFCFYQPLVFFLYQPFRLLTSDPTTAMGGVVALVLVLGALAGYRLLSRTGQNRADPWLGLFGAALFSLTPYLYVNLLVRGDVSELAAMCLFPWCLCFLRELADAVNEGRAATVPVCGLAISSALVFLAHPITALLAAPGLLVIALFLCVGLDGFRGGLALRVLAAGAVALLLTTPYWQPLISLRDEVNLDSAFEGYFQPTLHTVRWDQFLVGPWAYTGSGAGDAPDGMSFELGRLHLALGLMGVVVGWSSRFIRGAALAYVLSVVAMTPAAAGLWTVSPFSRMQFPWRMLSVTAGLQMALVAGWLPVSSRLVAAVGRKRWALLLALFLLVLGWRPEQFRPASYLPNARDLVQQNIAAALNSTDPLALKDEFRPLTTPRAPGRVLGDAPMVEVQAGAQNSTPRLTPTPANTRHHIEYSVVSTEPSTLVLNQLYFPGWRVWIGDEPLPDKTLRGSLAPDGRMTIRLPGHSGSRVVRARYTGPPGGVLRLAGVMLGLVLLTGLALLERRRTST